MSPNNLLVELFVEELPPKALAALGASFGKTLAATLVDQGLAAADAAVTWYASPRRLAVHVAQVLAKAPDQAIEQKLMPVAVGLDADGNAHPRCSKNWRAWGPVPRLSAASSEHPTARPTPCSSA